MKEYLKPEAEIVVFNDEILTEGGDTPIDSSGGSGEGGDSGWG